MSDVLKSTMSSLWIQLDGANTEPEFLGCHELDDISEPLSSFAPIRCRKADGSGWRTVGQSESPPDNVTTTVTTLLYSQRDLIEKLRTCPANLFILQRECGPVNVFSGFTRGQILYNVRAESRTFSNMLQREADDPSTVAVAMVADSLIDIDGLVVTRIATTEPQALNSVWSNTDLRCADSCGTAQAVGELVYASADGGAATANVQYSHDLGLTYAALATDPLLAIGLHAMAITRFSMGGSDYRVLVSECGIIATQGKVAYTDNNGAGVWTPVTIGGAAAGHGAQTGHSLFALDMNNIWLATLAGYIYKSTDGGETWTAVDAAGISVANYYCIHFADEQYGVAGGVADKIAISSDGGINWTAAAVTGGGGEILCCKRIDKDHIWVGDDDGKLWYSNTGGVGAGTWTQRTGWVGSGIGDVKDIMFVNELVGFMLHNDAGVVGTVLQTIDGGATWTALDTPANLGLNKIAAVSTSLAHVVGEVGAAPATAVILRVAALGV
jgi:photosystem II stability/assembly factor-like uncharacterized protein